jgi:hypothetical protein
MFFPQYLKELYATTYKTKVGQSCDSNIGQWSVQWTDALLLGNETSDTAIHFIGQVPLAGYRRQS